MSTRHVTRMLAVAGWLAGMTLVLDGALILGVAVLAVMAALGFACHRWGPGWWLALRVRVKLRRAVRTAVKTGGSLERV